MSLTSADLLLVRPEIVLAAGICFVLVLDLFLRPAMRDLTYLATISLLAILAWVLWRSPDGEVLRAFGGAYRADGLSRVLKLCAVATVATVFLYSRPFLRARGLHHGEYYVLGLFALLGIMVLASAHDLLVLYIGLEMLSLSLVAMVAFNRDVPVAAEAAMKYFVLGAIASGILLYGMSLVYGTTGTLGIEGIGAASAAASSSIALWVGVLFIVAGIAFKFGAVPFHMWVADVYEGAPAPVTLFVGTAPKLGALALAVRLLFEGFPALSEVWQPALASLAVLSLALGNIVAIAQTHIRRMLAYSTIGHVGFILLGLVAGGQAGVQAALFYTLVYVLMAAAAFGIIVMLSDQGGESGHIDELRGLARRSPWFATMMMLVMVSMIGVPPLAGFYAKWWVLSELLESGHVGLALVAVLFSVIGAFYYLRVIRLMFFDAGTGTETGSAPLDQRLVLSVNALLLLVIGLLPDGLIALCARVLVPG